MLFKENSIEISQVFHATANSIFPRNTKNSPTTEICVTQHDHLTTRDMHATQQMLKTMKAEKKNDEKIRKTKTETYGKSWKMYLKRSTVVLRDLNEIFSIDIATLLVVFCTECDFSVSQEIYVMFWCYYC